MAVIFMGSFFHLPPTSQKFGGILLCITFSNLQLSFHGGTIILLHAKWFNLQNTQQNPPPAVKKSIILFRGFS